MYKVLTQTTKRKKDYQIPKRMASASAAAAAAAAAAVVDRGNENYDELADPEFPEITMTIQTDTKTLGTLFEKNDDGI